MTLLIAIIGALMALFFIIFLHELGHFFAAKLFKFKIVRFSLGFGKALFSFRGKSGTEYRLAIFPLGGYVKLAEVDEKQQAVWKRMVVVLAGPMANFLLAFIAYWAVFIIGVIHIPPSVGHVFAHSLAQKAGFKTGDEILQINHISTPNWQSVLMAFMINMGDSHQIMAFRVKTSGNTIKHYGVNLAEWHIDRSNPEFFHSLGILPKQPNRSELHSLKMNAWEACALAFKEVGMLAHLNFIILKKMLTTKISLKALGGPISVFHAAGKASTGGWQVYLAFIGFISVTIGFLNLLPIPGLDGGHFLFYLIEAIFRNPLPEYYQRIGISLGMIFLIFLMLQATINDLIRFL